MAKKNDGKSFEFNNPKESIFERKNLLYVITVDEPRIKFFLPGIMIKSLLIPNPEFKKIKIEGRIVIREKNALCINNARYILLSHYVK